MAILFDAFREKPRPCAYLANEPASLDVRIMMDVSAAELGALLDRGWRRFGPMYFRPACPCCSACTPTRVVVAGHRPSRNQRRVLAAAARLSRATGMPRVDDERIALYERWHHNRERARAWEPADVSADRYATELAFPHPAVREVTFRDGDAGDRLVGVGIVDDVPGALSAVYFFWDPAYSAVSMGTAHVLLLIDEAARRGLSHVHLGYHVAACPSLAYKERFQPQEVLVGWPGEDERPVWVRKDPSARASYG